VRKSSSKNRRSWLAGAAASAAGGLAASANADPVTVDLNNNDLTATANNLNPDLTGDSIPDIYLSSAHDRSGPTSSGGMLRTARLHINGFYLFLRTGTFYPGVALFSNANSPGLTHLTQESRSNRHDLTVQGDIPFTFTDAAINGGLSTPAELLVEATDVNGAEIILESYTYDQLPPQSASAPDAGSTLALLALGAGGVMALRQRRKTAKA
jgi:hypothetical protein